MLRLNLGAGDKPIDGYVSIDRKNGQQAYPLTYDDASVDEIYASHILEHFGHRIIPEVLADWYRVLRPGGIIRVSVPDFDWIAEQHTRQRPVNTLGFVMGGQTDDDDYHYCIFNRAFLAKLLADAGFRHIRRWDESRLCDDCSQLPCSLNLQAQKPVASIEDIHDTYAILSAPRFGPISHFRYAYNAFFRCGIPYQIVSGAYWHQVLAEQMEHVVSLDPPAQYVITVDYDTLFTADDVRTLYELMQTYDEYDAICPVHMKRNQDAVLINFADRNGRHRSEVQLEEFENDVTDVVTGHFGLTFFRVNALKRCPRPWFMGRPNKEQRWGMHRRDPDMAFWDHWVANGFRLGLACHVILGHIQEMIVWPDRQFKPIYQIMQDYDEHGMPTDTRD